MTKRNELLINCIHYHYIDYRVDFYLFLFIFFASVAHWPGVMSRPKDRSVGICVMPRCQHYSTIMSVLAIELIFISLSLVIN